MYCKKTSTTDVWKAEYGTSDIVYKYKKIDGVKKINENSP